MKLFVTIDDGGRVETLLSEDRSALCAELLGRLSGAALSPEDKTLLRLKAGLFASRSKEQDLLERTRLAREGVRQWGEPIVLLQPGTFLESLDYRPGDELSGADLDKALASKAKGNAVQMALYRARKLDTPVAVIVKHRSRFSEKEIAFTAESDPQYADRMREEERAGLAREVKFCRVSDFSLLLEQFPEAHERWARNRENEELEKLPPAERAAVLAREQAEFVAGREAREAASERARREAEVAEAAKLEEATRLEEEAELAAVAERSAKKRTERLRAAEREQQAAGESIVQQPNEKENEI